MLLTGHKSRAIFDRYNIIHEQELLDAGDQLVAYLAQQAQAPRRRAHPAGTSRRRAHRAGPPPRATRHRVRGRRGPDTARLCAAARGQATRPGRPAIVAHAATGWADAAEHGHAPDGSFLPSLGSLLGGILCGIQRRSAGQLPLPCGWLAARERAPVPGVPTGPFQLCLDGARRVETGTLVGEGVLRPRVFLDTD